MPIQKKSGNLYAPRIYIDIPLLYERQFGNSWKQPACIIFRLINVGTKV